MQFKSAIKTLAWLAAAVAVSVLAVVCATQRQALEALRAEQRVQQEKLRELDRLRAENEHARHLQDQAEEIDRLRENTKDLLRLRNEVTQLRKQLAELETLRAANAQLLQAVQGVGPSQPNQLALIAAARKKGAILGVTIRPADPGQTGVVVTGVDSSSPVATSGVLPGDVIVALDGRPVQTPGQLMAEMLTRTPGETVVVDAVRTNTILRFQVQTRAWPEPKP
jgi:predicted metalloprotease with PDZ domain